MTSQPDRHSSATRRPGRPRQSKDQSGDVRERLLDAATELAVERGFEASGLREIAARAEVSPGMIAYYFGDRSGLHEAIFARAFDRIAARVRALLGDSERTRDDRLSELVRIQVETIAADPWLPRLLMREVLSRDDSPMAGFIARTVAEGPLQMMVSWLAEEQARHGIRDDLDPRMLAVTIASLASFPFLMLPMIGDHIGVAFDDDFPDRLIEHNQKFLTQALRARTEEER